MEVEPRGLHPERGRLGTDGQHAYGSPLDEVGVQDGLPGKSL